MPDNMRDSAETSTYCAIARLSLLFPSPLNNPPVAAAGVLKHSPNIQSLILISGAHAEPESLPECDKAVVGF